MAYDGFIEIHDRTSIAGWCVTSIKEGEIIDLQVMWGDICLRKVRANWPREDIKQGFQADRSGFHLQLSSGLIDLLPAGTALTVRCPNGQSLPFYKPDSVELIGEALDGGARLLRHFDEGFVIDKWGALKLPFRAMGRHQREQYALAMNATSIYFRDKFGGVLFPHYGTLLGFEREGAFLPHDDDVDMSYISNFDSIEGVAKQFFGMVQAIRNDGHYVSIEATGQMHVRLASIADVGVDIFSSWISPGKVFNTYFGVSGVIAADIVFAPMVLEGVEVDVPAFTKDLLALTYGPHWLVPDPHFQWTVSPEVEDLMEGLKAIGRSRAAALSTKKA